MNSQANLERKIQKHRAFFADDTPGQIIATVAPYTFPIDYGELAVKPLNQWDFERDAEAYAEACVAHLRYFMDYTRELDNDYMPFVMPGYGVGVNSAFLSGSAVTLGEDTSWAHPVVFRWEDMETLRPSEDNLWVRVMKRVLARAVALCGGDYAVSTYAHFAPVDLANALRGNQLFYDVYDEPEQVKRLLSRCADATIWLEKTLRRDVPKLEGGRVIANMWFEGDCCFLSEDGADLCAPWVYADLCRPATQKVLDALGGAYIHHHAKGMHIQKEIAVLKGLKSLELSWDPGCPRPIDMLEQVFEWTGNVPLQTRCTAQDVYRHIGALKKGRVSLMIDVTSLREAQDVLEFVHRNSRI